ncbi:Molybdate/tungstate transport system permease protein WtpB [uncultured archaeon]|nr:Molybdate/tungstate transport system permease protein WtpB [uncultured archaeon]
MDEISAGFVRALQLIVTLDPQVVEITARSLSISLISVLIASLIDIPIGGIIQFHNFRGKRALINLIQTFYSLPTVTVGLLVFLVLSRSGPLGSLGLLFSPGGMIIGQTILITPIMIGLTISALGGVSVQIRETAVSLGATDLQVIFTVMKEAKAAVIAAILLGFGRALSEVGVAMMIGGNIRGYTRVLTTAISLETSMGDLELSIALGIILISISLAVNLLLNRIQGR